MTLLKKKLKSTNGEPTKAEARQIVQDWFDHFEHLVGSTTYTAESFDIISVTGNFTKATINLNGRDLSIQLPFQAMI